MSAFQVRVDWIACDGRGVCAEILPERIVLDDWGYPIIDPRPVRGTTLKMAKKAVAICPKLALSLVPIDDPVPVAAPPLDGPPLDGPPVAP
ncbi:MAG: ferredoxin [Acidimicrobiia bacterium]